MAGMKSALELAMEKINAQQAQTEAAVSLTDAQRQEISDLRKQYDAKIAEKDIMLQADIRQLIQQCPLRKRWLQRSSYVRSFSKAKRLSRRSWKQKSRPCVPAHRRTIPHATTTHDTPAWRLVVGAYLAGWAAAAAVARLVLWGARRTGIVIPLSSP